MKNFKYTVLLIGFFVSFQDTITSQISSIQDLELIEKKSNHRLLLAASTLAILGCYNHQKILSCYRIYPFSSLIFSYFTGTFLIDAYNQYKVTYKNLFLLRTINKIYFYIKSALFIEPETEKCFKLIEEYSHFSIQEIEQIMETTTVYSLKCLNCTPTTQVAYECPNLYKLADHAMNLQEIIVELKDDPEFYQELLPLKKNNMSDKEKTETKEKLLKKLGKKINQNIKFLIKK